MRHCYPHWEHIFNICVEFKAAANQSQTNQFDEFSGLLSQWKMYKVSEMMPATNP